MLLLPIVSAAVEFATFVSNNASVYSIAQGLSGTRTLITDPAGDILTIARGLQHVVALYEDPPGSNDFKRQIILDGSGRNQNWTHGLVYRKNYLYVSSDIMVWRYPYTPGSRRLVDMSLQEEIIYNMGKGGKGGAPLGHTTRTLLFSPDDYLYIGISSLENVDPDSSRSRVVRFKWYDQFDTYRFNNSIDFDYGEVWADGLRNPLALEFDRRGRLYELDNGPDNLERPDLGKDIYPDNPVEELNLLDGPMGTFYGYPYCFSAGNLTRPFGTDPDYLKQFAWEQFGIWSDSRCQTVAFNRPPILGLPAHSSPIQMRRFTENDGCGTTPDSWPCSMVGDFFATLHGSWNTPRPVGYSVIRIVMNQTDYPVRYEYIGETKNFRVDCESRNNLKCFRPAGITFKNGALFVSSDSTGEIVRLAYDPFKKGSAITNSFYKLSVLSIIIALIF
jgi:glucose/arabinose dehydrogenase